MCSLFNFLHQIQRYYSRYNGKYLLIQAQHSSYNSNFKGKVACGFSFLPFRTKIQGPIAQQFQPTNNEDIIDEAFKFFRINVLFKNFEVKGPADKVLIYLFVFISHLFKCVENIKDEAGARKRLAEVTATQIIPPKDKANFMSMMLEDGNNSDKDAYNQYVKQLRAETVNRFLQKFFKQGIVSEDFKFWMGLGKKKFMGMNYASMF